MKVYKINIKENEKSKRIKINTKKQLCSIVKFQNYGTDRGNEKAQESQKNMKILHKLIDESY